MYEKYLKAGVNCIAVSESKTAIFPWKRYQSEMITDDDLRVQMSDKRAKGVAIICGAVSGNLEVIDVDTKYADFDLYSEIKELVNPDIWAKLHIVRTKSGGYHLLFRCEYIEGNQKLAERPATEAELKANPVVKTYCIIETRGEGGYVVAPPTEGYTVVQKGLSVVTLEEREHLIEVMRSFNSIVVEQVIEAHDRPSVKDYGASPFDAYNKNGDVRSLFEECGWKFVSGNSERDYYLRPGGTSKHSGSYNKSMGLFSVFSTNTPFLIGKGYKPAIVFAILKCGGDFSRAAKELLDLGFGERRNVVVERSTKEVRKMAEEGYSGDEITAELVKKYGMPLADAAELVVSVTEKKNLTTFWDVDSKGRISINRYKLQIFLSVEKEFLLYFYDNGINYRLIRHTGGIAHDSSTEQIKKEIKGYIDSLPDEFDGGVSPADLLELIYRSSASLFNDGFFEFFNRADLNFLRDEAGKAFFPFKNGIVEVTKAGIALKSYGELGRSIWQSQLIDHEIVVDQGVQPMEIEYYKFIRRINGDDEERIAYCITLMGYLLHKYKDPGKPFAVILAEETENEANGGGTGKGIFVKALSYLMQVVRLDGKNFKSDKSFAFQRVDIDTKIIAIEDTRKNVDFESFYPIITEGVTVEKKNQDEFFIPYKDSPKIMFTTNYTIPNNGNHAKRRQRVLEFAPFFGVKHTPEDEFGHKLFEDWDKDEWNRFYNFMFYCVNEYLEVGILKMENSDKLAKKQIRVMYGEEFLEFMLTASEEKNLPVKLETLYNDFLSENGFEKKDFSMKKFGKGALDFLENLKISGAVEKKRVHGNKKTIVFW